MSDKLYPCVICDKDILPEDVPDMHWDDSGEYHYDCYRDWADEESRYWAGQYYASKNPLELTVQEQLDAYEPGSAKRYAMEQELSGH
jgi:hypothetical protein